MRFETEISLHFYKLRCVPCFNECQRIVSQYLNISPSENIKTDVDTWGNAIQYGSQFGMHDSFTFVSSGVIETSAYSLPACQAEGIFFIPSALTGISPSMSQFCWNMPEMNSPLDKALYLSNKIYEYMRYTPGVTNIYTTAIQAFIGKQGVCQDYAHILIALCRYLGIATRYVNGLMQGTGETHAWVEVYDGEKWRAIDPTNNKLIEYGYIKIAHGRDAADCPVNRGVFTGKTQEQSDIRVIVEEIK